MPTDQPIPQSPITPARLADQQAFGDLAWDSGGALVWLEKRPPGGLLLVKNTPTSGPRELNPDRPARGRVGYGGGDFSVAGGQIYFVEAASDRLFRQALADGSAHPLTPDFGGAASPALSPDGRWLVYVHTYQGSDCLAVVDAGGQFWPQQLVTGDDFYMAPCWHPAGDQLAWIAWNNPHMPWDSATLVLADLRFSEGSAPSVVTPRSVAGGKGVSVLQPAFSPDGRTLAYLSDESGAWQIHLYDLPSEESRRLTDLDGEIGGPAWIQGQRFFAFNARGDRLLAIRQQGGFCDLWQIEVDSGQAERFPLPEGYTWLEQIAANPAGEGIALIASGWRMPPAVLARFPDGGWQILAGPSGPGLPPDVFARPQPLSWPGTGGQVHGLYYPPSVPRKGDYPPLVVYIHSGPTGLATAAFDLGLQYFTSRGYAVLAPNYRGSSGYGRAYRDALRGAWGEVDVEDVVSGARHLVAQGLADAERLVLIGGSAGGMTALLALARYPGLFRAAVCRYPVVDHINFGAQTHKFEAHYNEFLLGPLPEAAEVYRRRSPLTLAGRIQDPVAVFHGGQDPVVPQTDSDALVAALRANGVPCEYRVFPDEGHGFRAPETQQAYYEAVDRFLEEHLRGSVQF